MGVTDEAAREAMASALTMGATSRTSGALAGLVRLATSAAAARSTRWEAVPARLVPLAPPGPTELRDGKGLLARDRGPGRAYLYRPVSEEAGYLASGMRALLETGHDPDRRLWL